MTPELHVIGLDEPFTERLAGWILATSPGAAEGDLTGALVVLPSVRACAKLRHALLEGAPSGADGAPRAALLLPDVATPKQLVGQLAGRLGWGGLLAAAPPDELRALLLADRLRELDWVARHPDSAAGLAEELVRTFDEARRAEAAWLLDESAPALDPELAAGQREIFRKDLERLREAFRLYRAAVPVDATDLLAAVADRLAGAGAPWPGPAYVRVAVAGFSELDALTARILRGALAAGTGHLFLAGSDDALSRDWIATFRDPRAGAHPLAPSRRVREALGPASPAGDAATGAERAASAAGERAAAPGPELISCANEEEESRVAAGIVCRELRERGAAARIGVATADRALARRIVAQLRDAGLGGVDDTGGQTLATLPAGRLCHFVLQAALTDLRYDPLLETLTHPFVRLAQTRAEHSRRTLRFERALLRGSAPPSGLDEYRRRAREHDEAWRQRHAGAPDRHQPFVADIARAFGHLRARADGAHPWHDLLRALRRTWRDLAPDHPLDARDLAAVEEGAEREDVRALAALVDRLEQQAGALRETTLEGLTATLDRLMAAPALVVRPHRAALLPVQVMGLLEARLERFDLLVLAGAGEEILPGRQPRPLFLGEQARTAAGLPGWRDRLGLHADLFLRLLHNGARVVVTWPREQDGQPALPSPFVERLVLAGRTDAAGPRRGERAPLYRRPEDAPDAAAHRAAQTAFAAEPTDIPVHAAPRPLRRTSHSSLGRFRECPYRFLLEKGWGLSETDEVLEAFRPLDHGQRAHAALQVFLAPGGPGVSRLTAGDGEGALDLLREIAAAAFVAGGGSAAQRRLWETAFLAVAPAIVDTELARFREWEPRAVECPYELPLAGLHAWLARELAPAGLDPEPARLSAEEQQLSLHGTIDRVDLHRAGDGRAAVIDYKTGLAPTLAAVRQGDEPQLLLYAIAVEAGAVANLPGGSRVVQAAYYRLGHREPGLPRLHFDAGGPEGRAPLVRGARRILAEALAARDRGRPHPLIPAWHAGEETGGLPCRYCALRGVCRIDERDVPPEITTRLAEQRLR